MTGMPLKLSAPGRGADAQLTGRVVLMLGSVPVEVELAVPQGPVGYEDVLPILQQLTDFLVDREAAATEATGRAISCRAGCGACCRQMVPISQAEARALVRLVAALPEPRRSAVRARFDAALGALDAAGLLAAIDAAREVETTDADALGMSYFRAGVPCPFLEDEACSIHPDRPLACRQYLVTSPALNCRTPSPATIVRVPLPTRPSQALLVADGQASGVGWMPLVYALTYDDQVPPEPPTQSAPELLRAVFSRLAETASV